MNYIAVNILMKYTVITKTRVSRDDKTPYMSTLFINKPNLIYIAVNYKNTQTYSFVIMVEHSSKSRD
jgi:hypothetical protein